MVKPTEDLRIVQSHPLLSPQALKEALPASDGNRDFVSQSRRDIEAALAKHDSRLVTIVGPCSVHDPAALLDFATQFKAITEPLSDALLPVLRVYFEKPRTVTGWKGLINDPALNDSFDIHRGLRLARQVLLNVADLELPAASEFLDTTLGQYYADLVSFGAIGARTVESQVHRELASGLSAPVGFKNGTNGHVGVAIDAIRSARHSHWFPSLTSKGTPAILQSSGNEHGYLILRGGKDTGPNYHADFIAQTVKALQEHDLPASVIVDCSHGNSEKDPQRQANVVANLCEQIRAGQNAITGVMLESHLVGGSQKVTTDKPLTYGQSITDACLSLNDTQPLLQDLAEAVRAAR